jgi:hypothetical protein
LEPPPLGGEAGRGPFPLELVSGAVLAASPESAVVLVGGSLGAVPLDRGAFLDVVVAGFSASALVARDEFPLLVDRAGVFDRELLLAAAFALGREEAAIVLPFPLA